jgi:hypothetical protein
MLNRLETNRWPILAVLTILYWAVGFYPYQLPPYHNGAVRTGGAVLEFDTIGIAYDRDPPGWLPTVIASSALRVTLEARAAATQKGRWGRILTLSRNSHRSNLSIAQDNSSLVVRVRSPETDLGGRPGYVVEGVFAQPGWHRIELSIASGLLTVITDGREVFRQALPPKPLSNWSPGYQLALGNQLDFSRPWLGKMRTAGVFVAGRHYDYTLPDALETPATYRPPLANRYVQWLPLSNLKNGSSAVIDHALNLCGFIPFGMILAMLLQRPRSLYAFAAICCAMSLSIEAGQLFIAPRRPSIDDLLLNTLGGALGAWLGLNVRVRSMVMNH